jgi:hypothetical protein
MNPRSDVRNAVPSTDAIDVRCLADLPKYRSLEGRRRFLLQYWYTLATVPFFLSIVICVGVFPRLLPDTASGEELHLPSHLVLWVGHLWLFSIFCLFLYVGFSSAVPNAVGASVSATNAILAAFREPTRALLPTSDPENVYVPAKSDHRKLAHYPLTARIAHLGSVC